MNCAWCGESILPDERSAICADEAMHRECAFRAVVGSAAHIERHCSCYVYGSTENDDPALTKRQAAAAALAAYDRWQRIRSQSQA